MWDASALKGPPFGAVGCLQNGDLLPWSRRRGGTRQRMRQRIFARRPTMRRHSYAVHRVQRNDAASAMAMEAWKLAQSAPHWR